VEGGVGRARPLVVMEGCIPSSPNLLDWGGQPFVWGGREPRVSCCHLLVILWWMCDRLVMADCPPGMNYQQVCK